ncbi:delta-1-pyrroline-5-carboxylate dehydrogenase 12A1, mitochondrial-like isoform X1 [Raphanus sativus]|uniref:Delta-1-pyrroline-5-carboxylate dehydrogenase 12A1, mitochondrial-like isoform X1 n=1 Tax=Raphanus sativus TaxID=3726 RepID=A0A9W3D0Y0_RAPSA|nr:delta-1-pyrroline-5-carboxylate dehydrogenase 12A1, mitochondrial-like isoform X1 [Raphanus sativus]XP_056857409.1 delta-1-pyrroline-5-carboxylate dehydrogenase 12A1, mitochondrial-like isoform X1 [Raphanus sativus]
MNILLFDQRSLLKHDYCRLNHSLPFASVDAEEISGAHPAQVQNFVQGKWIGTSNYNTLLDPLNGEPFIKVSEVDESGVQVASLELYYCNVVSKSQFCLCHSSVLCCSHLLRACHTVPNMANPRMTLFTGSSRVAEKLALDLKGRIRLEDAAFDWKVLGPDVQEVDYVAWVCDQDAYACSGQKCSAQSMLFMHEIQGSKLLFGVETVEEPFDSLCLRSLGAYGSLCSH